ncbi:MAG TPA: nickel-responsive transcriptional regulator NikR [Nitrososphaera sp.]|nr:nickel-responsive transcriptional regulator NikR [Nitrososphaera sp.]
MPRDQNQRRKRLRQKKQQDSKVERISISLPPELLSEFDKSMKSAGFSDRSKAIQTALHAFIDQNDWDKGEDSRNGAGAIMILYDNQAYSHDGTGTYTQHKYSDIISATTHMHLDHHNCLETIMVRGEIKKIKELAKSLSENRGIKSLKVHFVSIV